MQNKLLAKRHADTEASWACKASTLRHNETTKQLSPDVAESW